MSSRTKDALKMAGLAIDGLELIQSLTGVGGDKAAAALRSIDKVVASLRDGLDGKTTPDVVAHELDALRASLLNNDDAADAALRDKFGR